MTLITKLTTGEFFLPEQAQVCCLGSDVKLLCTENNALYDVPTEVKTLQAWMSQQPNLTSATYTELDALLSFLDTQCTQLLQANQPKAKTSWNPLSWSNPFSFSSTEKSSPLGSLILQVQQLMTTLQQKRKEQRKKEGFLQQIPSNRDDRKTVFEWLRTREYNPEISYNETEKCFEISNISGETVPLTDALKEIDRWLAQQYCFSEDPQQVKINHSHLLSLLEVNLLHIKEEFEGIKGERTLTERIRLYISKHIHAREAVSPLLETVLQLLTQVKELKLVRDRSMAPEIVLAKQAVVAIPEEISSMSLQEIEEIQERVRNHKAAETPALSKAASSSAERAPAPVDVFSQEELKEIQQRLNGLIQTVVDSLSEEEIKAIQQRASALKNASLEAYMDEL